MAWFEGRCEITLMRIFKQTQCKAIGLVNEIRFFNKFFFFTKAKFLDEIQTKVLSIFLLATHSCLYSLALPWNLYFFKLTQTSYSFSSSVPVHCKGKRNDENLIENHTTLPYGLRNPYRNLKSENSQDYCLSRNLNEIVRSWIRLQDIKIQLVHKKPCELCSKT